VHHLLENLPAPKSEQARLAVLSLSSAPSSPRNVVPLAESNHSAHDHTTHDHSSHSHHHNGKTVDRHNHAHPHHSHSRDAAPVQTQTAAAPAPSSASTPLHANAPKRDAHHDNSARTDCVVQAAAQQAQLAPLQSAQIVFFGTAFALRLDIRPVNLTPFDPSPFSQRAPPRI
jgi:ABC-type Zn2+ transport system substrate-binding protein/surface adhesin